MHHARLYDKVEANGIGRYPNGNRDVVGLPVTGVEYRKCIMLWLTSPTVRPAQNQPNALWKMSIFLMRYKLSSPKATAESETYDIT
uniref:Uncharacterized protein n=1 Tax=Steinernema glaseri TaxID=37863 RepID=A0A1I8A402_9BILA